MIYNFVLIYAMQQRISYTYTYTYIYFLRFFFPI